MQNEVEKVINFFGTQGNTANALGCSQTTVCKWLHGKMNVSSFYALKIEKLTNGEFKAVDLCPRLAEIENLKP